MTTDKNESEGETTDSHRSTSEVRDVYDEIAPHFSKTRAYPWPEVESFLAEQSGYRGLDIGCGNGRHTTVLAECCDCAVGLDLSRSLLGEASEIHSTEIASGAIQFLQGDAESLPLVDNSVKVAIYIATIHHLPTKEQRIKSLREVGRVLDTEGVALVSTWSTIHDRFDGDGESETGFDTMVDWTLPGGETIPRYYHIYSPAEFRRDIGEAGLDIELFERSSGNCYVTVTDNS